MDTAAINAYMNEGKEYMDNAITHLNGELLKIRAGKASPSMLNGVMVDYYGNPTPLNQVANISTPDSKSISIQPWEKSMLAVIEQSIFASNLGLTPMNDGETVRINIPPLTEERRKDLVKQVKKEGEDAKVSLRHARHKMMDFIKKAVKNGYPEDGGTMKEEEVEKMIKKYTEDIELLLKAKEKEIMTV